MYDFRFRKQSLSLLYERWRADMVCRLDILGERIMQLINGLMNCLHG